MTKTPSPTPGTSPSWFAETLEMVLARRDLAPERMARAMEEVVAGRWGEAEVGALLIALRMKGETADEIAAAARVMRSRMVRLDTGRDDVLDTSGTGGDGSHTFNISTAAALVVAGTGQPVVKHGNRAVSGRCGSADVLAALGVAIEADVIAARAADRAGIAFCFAPKFHPALATVSPIRRRLGVRTLFNCLGPLVNPAEAPYQLTGVGKPELLDLLAGALAKLGVKRALLVCSRDGLDEVSLSAATEVREVRGGVVSSWEWRPEVRPGTLFAAGLARKGRKKVHRSCGISWRARKDRLYAWCWRMRPPRWWQRVKPTAPPMASPWLPRQSAAGGRVKCSSDS